MRDPYRKRGKFSVTRPSSQEGVFRWKKSLPHGTIDLRLSEDLPRERLKKAVPRLVSTQRSISSKLKSRSHPRLKEKAITREQVLREMAAIYTRDSALNASLAAFVVAQPKESSFVVPPRRRPPVRHSQTGAPQHGAHRFIAPRAEPAFSANRALPQKKQRGIPAVFLILTLILTVGITLSFFMAEHILRKNADLSARMPRIYERIKNGTGDMTLGSFMDAQEHFAKAEEEIVNIKDALKIFDGKAAALGFLQNSLFGSSYSDLLMAGENLASAGKDASQAMELLHASVFPDVSQITLADEAFAEARAAVFRAQENMRRIEEEETAQNKDNQFLKAYSILAELRHSLQSMLTSADTVLELLGVRSEKTYLIVVENPNIMRPTGGFIRAVAKVKLQGGKVSDFALEDVYAIDARLDVKRVPPYPLTLLATGWSLHDSNWFSQFPATAKKIAWFYEKSGGEAADGVIALTTSALARIIDNLGGVISANGGRVSGDMLQKAAAEDQALLGATGKPSALSLLLAKFLPELVSSLTDVTTSAQRDKIFQGLREDIATKNVLFYTFDEKNAALLGDLKLTGERANDNFTSAINDKSEVVFTNLSGLPLDKRMTTRIESTTVVLPGGELERVIHVSRTLPKKSRREASQSAVDYMRFYAPLGSTFVSAEGFSPAPELPNFSYDASSFLVDPEVELTRLGANKDPQTLTDIFEEGGMQVFGNWLTVKSGETKTAQIVYRLPQKLTGTQSYALEMSSQPGAEASLLLRLETNGNAAIISCTDEPYTEGVMEKVLEFSSDESIYCTLKKM